jgi:hypothetical protein
MFDFKSHIPERIWLFFGWTCLPKPLPAEASAQAGASAGR